MNKSSECRRQEGSILGAPFILRAAFGGLVALCLLVAAPWGCVPSFLQSKPKPTVEEAPAPTSTTTKESEPVRREQDKGQPAAPGEDVKAFMEAKGPGKKGEAKDDAAKTERLAQHDHSKYVDLVKKAAQDLADREPEWSYARLCNKPRTDEWYLGLYFHQAKTFYYVRYVWNEIDEKWVKAFKSDPRPIAQFEGKLERESAGKTCVVLDKAKR